MTSTMAAKPKLEKEGKQRIVVVIVYMMVCWTLLFLAAGTVSWPAAWLYVALQFVIFLTLGLYAAHVNPEVINERGRKSDKTKSWDKIFSLVYAPQIFLTPIIAGLDHRLGWSNPGIFWQIVGTAILIPGFSLPYWAMMVNDFLTVTVRLQEERGHRPITHGPYRFVRHPMYAGAILSFIGTPLLLGTWWTFIPCGIAILAVIVRTALEDKTLQAELPGYADYAQRTRYRLLPGVW
ncbi:MAG: isoprenylcysteine carboxylmethyltransferase family protein [Ardenticatenaceae bacterium]|nr:isoprenylcysteine carboxylmethyltransferase family protein [Ardenticatenaceae bacterium]